MRAIAAHVMRTLDDTHILSNPSLSSVTTWSVAVKEISVLFSTLRDICDVLCIRDLRDYENIHCQAPRTTSPNIFR